MYGWIGLHDPRVAYWEPAKWVARMREVRTDDSILLLKTDMSSGHCESAAVFVSEHVCTVVVCGMHMSTSISFFAFSSFLLAVSASDRYKFIKEMAHEYAFILDQVR